MSEVSRRSALKGAAWSVPVIAAAVASPIAAASGPGALINLVAGLRFSQEMYLMGEVSPLPLPTLEKDYFYFEGEPAVTVTSVANYGIQSLDVVLQLSAPITSGRILTINIPGYAITAIPVYR